MDIQEIRKWHSIFKSNNELFEIRIIYNGIIYSGYFYDVEEVIKNITPFDNMNIYFSVNKINDACSSRNQFNRFMKVKGSSTSKKDIVQRLYIPIDIDVTRPSDICSTDEEKEYAHKKALEVYKFLKSNNFSEPIISDSSSGYHLYYPIDMPANDDSENLIKAFFTVLSNFYTDERVKIDPAVCDSARIMRLSGTWSRKGRNSEERPHRMCKILKYPQEQIKMSFDFVKEFVNKYELKTEDENEDKQSNQNRTYSTNEEFDVRKFLSDYNIEVHNELPHDGGTKFVLKECPFDHTHHAPDSAVFISKTGKLGFKCLHASCSNYSWRDFRLRFDPHAYDNQKQYEQRQFKKPTYIPERKKYKIQEENPSLGKKWLSLSDVDRVNLSNIPTIKTGFTELDKKILGLNLGEVTLLSGSNSAGKSSWLDMLILNVINNGNKVALWSGELPPDKLKMWIHNAAAGKKNLLSKQRGDFTIYETNPIIAEKIDNWLDGKLFLYNNEYSSKWEQIFNDINELLKLDVKLFILDNLFSMDIDIFDGDKNNKQKELILQICQLARKEKIHIVLVAHPRKAVGFLRKTDISGTADLTNAVDNVFICHRVNNDFIKAGGEFLGVAKIQDYLSYGNCVEVCKNRMFGVVDYLVGMYYEVESRRFLNRLDENIIYGWEEQYEQGEISYIQPNASFIPQPVKIEEPTLPPLRTDTFSSYIPKEYIEPQIPNDYDDDCPF